MFSSEASENLKHVFDNNEKVADVTLQEILHLLNFYKRDQFYIGRTSDDGFGVFDGEINGDCARFTRESVEKKPKRRIMKGMKRLSGMKLLDVLPELKVVAEQNGLRLNRLREFNIACDIYCRSLVMN